MNFDNNDLEMLEAVRAWLLLTTLATTITDDGVIRYLLAEWWVRHKQDPPPILRIEPPNDRPS